MPPTLMVNVLSLALMDDVSVNKNNYVVLHHTRNPREKETVTVLGIFSN
jgi:hypothetical protein